MYAWRQASQQERARMVAARKRIRWPWHAPPHFGEGGDANVYHLSAACYEHRPFINTASRRDELTAALRELVNASAGDLRAWAVLPNHYHLLAAVDLDVFAARVGRLHNGKSTQWNREDGTPGRKVWHHFADRRIRGERHYYGTINYIHANPVHHGHAQEARAWPWSSYGHYREEVGSAVLDAWQREYDIQSYGEGWDAP